VLPTAPERTAPETIQTRRRMIQKNVQQLLERAYAARVVDFRCSWTMSGTNNLVVGMQIAPWDIAYSAITRGPEIELEQETVAFRDFWKTKSQQRRFKDGSIISAVLWDTVPTQCRIREIARSILGLHMKIPADNIQQPGLVLMDELTLMEPEKPGERYDPMEVTGPMIGQAFAKLHAALQRLDHRRFPLDVTDVWPADPALRRTAVTPPLKNLNLDPPLGRNYDARVYSNARCVKPILVIMEFQTSKAWPDHLEAIAHMKTTLYIQLSKRLGNDFDLVTVPHRDFVDVHVDGYVFRLMIRQAKEQHLLVRLGRGRSARQLERLLVHTPMHHQFIKHVAASCSSFSEGVRLAIHWCSSHMLTPHFSTECIELLMAYVYIQPLPYAAPRSAYIALQRFWNLLHTFDWSLQPLLVQSPDHDSFEADATKAFLEESRAEAVGAMFLATWYCPSSSPMTQSGPDRPMLQRAQHFAKASETIFLKMMAENAADAGAWEKLFTTSLRPYHLLMDLQPSLHPYAPYGGQPLSQLNMSALHWFVDYDIIKHFIEMLTDLFAEHAMFFYNPTSGLTVGVVATSEDAKNNLPLLAEKIADAGQGIVTDVRIQADPQTLQHVTPKQSSPTSRKPNKRGREGRKGGKATSMAKRPPKKKKPRDRWAHVAAAGGTPKKQPPTDAPKKSLKIIKKKKVASA